ncbi:27518_t:CDS:2, partial [Racocetra persica]
QVITIEQEMQTINRDAKCCQKICSALLERVDFTKTAMESLERNPSCYKERFEKQDYFDNWVKLINKLENIKKFAKENTQLHWFKKYVNASEIKNNFVKHIKEFEDICKALDFNTAMYNSKQKEMEAQDVADDIEHLKKTVAELKSSVDQINSKFPGSNVGEKPSVPQIDPEKLSESQLSYN